MEVDGPSRGRYRPKRIYMEIVKIDTKTYNLPEDLAHDRLELRNIIYEPNIVGIRL